MPAVVRVSVFGLGAAKGRDGEKVRWGANGKSSSPPPPSGQSAGVHYISVTSLAGRRFGLPTIYLFKFMSEPPNSSVSSPTHRSSHGRARL